MRLIEKITNKIETKKQIKILFNKLKSYYLTEDVLYTDFCDAVANKYNTTCKKIAKKMDKLKIQINECLEQLKELGVNNVAFNKNCYTF